MQEVRFTANSLTTLIYLKSGTVNCVSDPLPHISVASLTYSNFKLQAFISFTTVDTAFKII